MRHFMRNNLLGKLGGVMIICGQQLVSGEIKVA
jgi:hypothetical protein